MSKVCINATISVLNNDLSATNRMYASSRNNNNCRVQEPIARNNTYTINVPTMISHTEVREIRSFWPGQQRSSAKKFHIKISLFDMQYNTRKRKYKLIIDTHVKWVYESVTDLQRTSKHIALANIMSSCKQTNPPKVGRRGIEFVWCLDFVRGYCAPAMSYSNEN